jgi:hypothetical protein
MQFDLQLLNLFFFRCHQQLQTGILYVISFSQVPQFAEFIEVHEVAS